MKLKKINEDHYIVVDDKFDPIGSDGKYVHKSGRIWQWDSMMAYVSNNPPQLITHSTQPLELICCTPVGQIKRYVDCKGCDRGTIGYNEVKPLSLLEVKEVLGIVDVEKKALEISPVELDEDEFDVNETHRVTWIDGYNQALEDNKDKKYTNEDMLTIRNQLVAFLLIGDVTALDKIQAISKYTKWFDECVESLQPQTEWEVEFVDDKLKLKS